MAIVILIIAMALLIDFITGMNDAANSISTVIATGVPSPCSPVKGWSRDNLLTKDGN